tara:strand:+ start:893 stop:1291 length:399 start_codon:yes stop_codon:yes gene_type:complete
MEIEKIFKNLILIDFTILILIVISTFYQSNQYSEVYQYLDKGLLANYGNFKSIISIILFFLYLFTLNLLYRFIYYGKSLYLFIIVAGLLLNYFNGSVIYTAYGGILDQIGGIISGAILVLLYFSPVKENFKR